MLVFLYHSGGLLLLRGGCCLIKFLHDALIIQFVDACEQPAMNRWAHPMRTMLDIEDEVLAITLGLARR